MIHEKYLIEFEKEIGAEFPENYRRGILVQNGGLFDVDGMNWHLFPIFDPSDTTGRFESESHVLKATEENNTAPGYPTYALTIGVYGNDLILLFPGGDTFYTWDWMDIRLDDLGCIEAEFVPKIPGYRA